MKNVILLMSLMSLLNSSPAMCGEEEYAPQGGVSGSGGGNAFESTPEDVERFITSKDGDSFGSVVAAFALHAKVRQFLNAKYVSDPDIKKLLQKMYVNGESGSALVGETGHFFTGIAERKGKVIYPPGERRPRYIVRERCNRDAGGEDASTKNEHLADICFNKNRLARYPKGELEIELVTLAFHEFAHHFGADERVANKFQNYMKDFIRETFQFRNQYWVLKKSYPTANYTDGALRPGGIYKIKDKNLDLAVQCLDLNNKPKTLAGSNESEKMVHFVSPGTSGVFGSQENLYQVGCSSSFPIVECSIRHVYGIRTLFVGDFGNYREIETNVDEKLKELTLANVCQKPGANGDNGNSEPRPNGVHSAE